MVLVLEPFLRLCIHLFDRGGEIKKEIVAYKDGDGEWKPYCDHDEDKDDYGEPSARHRSEDERSSFSHDACCKLPQRGLGRSPSRNRIWCTQNAT